MIKKGLIEAIPAEAGVPVWREDEDGTPLTLRATAAAFAALGIETDAVSMDADAVPEEDAATDSDEGAEILPTDTDGAKPARKSREGTKQEALITMLKRPEGASIAEITAEFGWQAHTVRGAIAGALKKKLGLEVASKKIEGRGRVYNLPAD